MNDLLPPKKQKPPVWKRVLSVGAVLVLVAAGILGTIFPIVPGFPFLIGAVLLMPFAVPKSRDWINKLDRKLSERHRRKLRRVIKKIPIKRLRDAIQT